MKCQSIRVADALKVKCKGEGTIGNPSKNSYEYRNNYAITKRNKRIIAFFKSFSTFQPPNLEF
jgi:hypothetical protein